MKKLSIAALICMLATVCVCQVPKPVMHLSTSDIYVGGIVVSPDYGQFSTYLFKGGEVAYTRSFSSHVSLTADGYYVFGPQPYFGHDKSTMFSVTAGPKIYILTGRVRPYVTAQAGLSYQNSTLYNINQKPPVTTGKAITLDGFTYLMGGGLEYQIWRSMYIRAQAAIQPQPFDGGKPWYETVGVGVGYHF